MANKEITEKQLNSIYKRIGHQIKVHRTWIRNAQEEEIIKFVKTMGNQIINDEKK